MWEQYFDESLHAQSITKETFPRNQITTELVSSLETLWLD